jgi:ATPase family associated with various cellular activities (AAA)
MPNLTVSEVSMSDTVGVVILNPTDSDMNPGHSLSRSTTPSSSSMEIIQPTPNIEVVDITAAVDDKDIGMTCSLKNLYSGKEDKHGRFQWQDTIPKDVGIPVENAETAKFALIVRYVKVYNDPRKVLALHSVSVQSPLLKKLLQPVLKDYPGFSSNLKRLELKGKFEPLIHRWDRLKEETAKIGDTTEEEKQMREHAKLFYGLVSDEFRDVIDSSQDMIAKGVITFELLWTIFVPGSIVFTRQDGQEMALKLISTKYGSRGQGQIVLWVQGRYVDWDGSKFGSAKLNIAIPQFQGTRKFSSLAALPIDHHPDKEALLKRLLDRGNTFESIAGSHYRAYSGFGWNRCMFENRRVKYNITGRIVIDASGWNRFNPNFALRLSPLNVKDGPNSTRYRIPPPGLPPGGLIPLGFDPGYDDDDYDDSPSEEEDSGMPLDGQFLDEDDPADRIPLTDEQKVITTPLIRAYSLKNKLWLNMFVNCVKDISFSTNAFDRLVLPAKQKELILGFTESQKVYKEQFDDVIEGKGKGIIILLCGPPGVGKTLTAESVAEEMRVPLYMMSAGDLGLDPRQVDNTLKDILEMCTKWNAILLLDEADVFLEQRSLHELERNKLVSIFLRVLEYYEGIMFLTTNRVNTFDAAFQSRIHISLDYPELSMDSRRMIWKNFIENSPLENRVTDTQLDSLSLLHMNGRQIKNVLKTAQLLARRKSENRFLAYEHIMTVLDVTQHLHNTTQETERSRSAIFS